MPATIKTAEEIQMERLFVPGTLYHILRKPVAKGDAPSKKLHELVEWDTQNGQAKVPCSQNDTAGIQELCSWVQHVMNVKKSEITLESKSEKRDKKREEKWIKEMEAEENKKYEIIKASNPDTRFKRIVLSWTMVKDHGCEMYGNSMIKAMQWAE